MRPTFQFLTIATAVLGLGVGAAFAGGVIYGRGSSPSPSPSPTPAAGGAPSSGGAVFSGVPGSASGGAIPTAGVVESIDGETITVRTQAGGAVTVKLQPETQLQRQTPATAADLHPGATIVVSGQPDTDGTLLARTIQIGGPQLGVQGQGRTGSGSGSGPLPSGSPPSGR